MNRHFFNAGEPTGLDVETVLTLWRKLKVGEEITHEVIAAALRLNPKSARYHTVMTAVRKKFWKETDGVMMLCIPGKGYVYPTGDEQVLHGGKCLQRIPRMARRGISIVAEVADNRLGEQGKAGRDYIVITAQAMAMAAKAEAKKIGMVILPTLPTPAREMKG